MYLHLLDLPSRFDKKSLYVICIVDTSFHHHHHRLHRIHVIFLPLHLHLQFKNVLLQIAYGMVWYGSAPLFIF